jgi:hypothetical protein
VTERSVTDLMGKDEQRLILAQVLEELCSETDVAVSVNASR